jgi:Zn-finger nucleic acid-binding protein
MNCPQCDVEMTTLEGDEQISVCAECSGLWVEVGSLNRLLLHNNLGGLESLGGRLSRDGSEAVCRECRIDMTRIEKKEEFYETCEGCGNAFIYAQGEPAQNEAEAQELMVEAFHAFSGR